MIQKYLKRNVYCKYEQKNVVLKFFIYMIIVIVKKKKNVDMNYMQELMYVFVLYVYGIIEKKL